MRAPRRISRTAASGIAMLIPVFRGTKRSEEPGTGTLLGRILGGLRR